MGKDSQNSPITIKTLHSLLFTLHNSSVLTPKCHETTFMSLLKKRFTRRCANYTLSLGPRPPKFRSKFRKIHAGSLTKQQGTYFSKLQSSKSDKKLYDKVKQTMSCAFLLYNTGFNKSYRSSLKVLPVN